MGRYIDSVRPMISEPLEENFTVTLFPTMYREVMAVFSQALPLYDSMRATRDPGPARGTLPSRNALAPSYILRRSTVTSTSFMQSLAVNRRLLTAIETSVSRFFSRARESNETLSSLSS